MIFGTSLILPRRVIKGREKDSGEVKGNERKRALSLCCHLSFPLLISCTIGPSNPLPISTAASQLIQSLLFLLPPKSLSLSLYLSRFPSRQHTHACVEAGSGSRSYAASLSRLCVKCFFGAMLGLVEGYCSLWRRASWNFPCSSFIRQQAAVSSLSLTLMPSCPFWLGASAHFFVLYCFSISHSSPPWQRVQAFPSCRVPLSPPHVSLPFPLLPAGGRLHTVSSVCKPMSQPICRPMMGVCCAAWPACEIRCMWGWTCLWLIMNGETGHSTRWI